MDELIAKIQEHQEVVGSDGGHVGTVDGVENERIKLTRNDPEAGGEHHFIDGRQVASVNEKVRLSVSAADAKASWSTEG